MKVRYVLSSLALVVPLAVVALGSPASAAQGAAPGPSVKIPSMLRDAAAKATSKT